MQKIKDYFIRLLRQTEKYTKTDMVYLAEGGVWLGLGQIVASGAALITSIAFANLLPSEVFGLYKYVLSIASLLAITTLVGVDSTITQAVARGYEGTLEKGVKAKMKWGAIGSLISLIIATYYYTQGDSALSISFGIVAIFTPFSEAFDAYNSFLFGKKLFNTQAIYGSIKKIIVIISIVTILLITENVSLIIFVYFLSITIPSLFLFYKTKKKYKANDEIDLEAIPYGKKMSAYYIIPLITAELDKILIFQYVGAIDLAIYALAMAPTDQIKGLLKNINALAMPQFSQKSSAEIKKTITEKVKILAIGTCILVGIYILIAPHFFGFFFSKYLSSVIYSQILALSLIPVIISGFLYTVLESQRAEKELYQYNTHTNILSIIILLPLVYYFGIWGAVISRITIRSLTLLYSIYLIKKF